MINQVLKVINPYIQLLGYILLIAAGITIIAKTIKLKYDKNKDNKIDENEKEEIIKDNYDYIISFLNDSLKIIAKGIVSDTGCKLPTAENLILKSLNEIISKNDEIEKELNEELKIKEELEQDLKLQMEMERKANLKKLILEETLKKEGGENA